MTHKMNPAFRPMRFDREAMAQLIRQHVIWERDLSKAWAAFCAFPVVQKHMAGKSPAQRQVFETHALRYMRAYLPDAGFEYAVTHRYRTARLRFLHTRDAASDAPQLPTHLAPGRTDLCVLALRDFQPNDTIPYCTAALKDLSAAEDEALREEAASARAADVRDGRVRPQRDFSIIRSSSRKCSQLLLGPARFINHDCHPNAEFRRSGHQLSIRCIRPIKRNEEITTYYGDNYFEWGNKECMCATCEQHQRGFFTCAAEPALDESAGPETPSDESSRTLRSHTANAAREQTSIPLATDLIAYQLDPEATGPQCECLTCHAPFRAPEKWWVPDECGRCERHYKLYKCDWPDRHPKENPAEQTTMVRSLKRRAPAPTAPTKRPRKSMELPDTESLAHSSPVKLSPVREMPSASREGSPVSSSQGRPASRHRRFEVHSDESDDAWDEATLGPKILGHGASTDVLASYWGAPAGERRTRRPTTHGITVLSERAALSGRDPVAPRRKTSARESRRAATDERAQHALSLPDETDSARRTRHARPPATERTAPRERPTPRRSPASKEETDASTLPAPAPIPQIATTGPERTSVSNLALFWSGGVEGRTRQQARQGRVAPPVTTPVNAHRSATRRSVRHGPNGRVKVPRSPSPAAPAARASSTHAEALLTSEAPCEPDSKEGMLSTREASPANPSLAPRAISPAIKREAVSTRASEPRSTEALPRVPRPMLPLPTALPPGVPPRQPLRRNLRWGSGKTSASRPASAPAQPIRTAWPPLPSVERPSPAADSTH